jgi:hypothetical protein
VDLYIHSPIRLHGVVLNQLSTVTTLPFTSKLVSVHPLYEGYGGGLVVKSVTKKEPSCHTGLFQTWF